VIVALTGGTGFLGGHVLDRLIGAGHQVRALARKPQPDRDGMTWISGDLDNLAGLCASADSVIHVAGVVNADAAAFDKGNRQGTENILAAAQVAGVKRFVHVSSLSAREPQLSNYGASKRAAEDAVVASPLDWSIVRPPAIYGPGDTDNLELFRFAKRGIMPLPPKGRLSAIHADDLARLIVAMAEQAPPHAFYEADDGQPHGWSHTDYAQMIGAAVGRNPVTLALPKVALSFGAALDGVFRGAKAKLTRDRVSYMTHPDWVIDPAKRPPASMWTPQIPTLEGLKAAADWYRAKGWL
jgi:nucleoside-diphosphate-sugar epimerase